MAKKSNKDYVMDLCKESIELKQRAFYGDVSYEESQKLRKKQNEVFQKYMFAKKIIEAKRKVDEQQKKEE